MSNFPRDEMPIPIISPSFFITDFQAAYKNGDALGASSLSSDSSVNLTSAN